MIGGAAILVAGVAVAEIQQRAAVAAAPDILLEQLNPGTVIEQYVAQVVGRLRSADRAGDGLDRDDVTLARDQGRAQARASAVSQMLAQDLDGDFKVTRAEIERTARGEEPYRSREVESELDRFDANGDGVITIAEAAASAREPYGDGQLEALLALAPNGSGRLTAKELQQQAERAFDSVDRDGDGKISAAEYATIAERVQGIRMARSTPACTLPPLPDRARLVVYGGYEGDAISSAAIGGPDQETNLIDVTIEPGSTPLYLVLSSYESMVWRFSGATDRVANVVISSSQTGRPGIVPDRPVAPVQRRVAGGAFDVTMVPTPSGPRDGISASGVVGLAPAKVAIAPRGCPPYSYSSSGAGAKAVQASLKRALGRDPDAVFGSYSAQRISLPSGTVTRADASAATLPRGFDPGMWREATRYWPGGLVMVDPRRVVAKARVEPYQVLPSQMGLSQLVGSGAIQHLSSDKFRVVRPIAHMPPSMGGAHSVTLVIAKGVPVPPGDPVHSCVISEDSGQSHGARCRSSD
jgi:Ca2+-binding EF-hand superfamily protein